MHWRKEKKNRIKGERCIKLGCNAILHVVIKETLREKMVFEERTEISEVISKTVLKEEWQAMGRAHCCALRS